MQTQCWLVARNIFNAAWLTTKRGRNKEEEPKWWMKRKRIRERREEYEKGRGVRLAPTKIEFHTTCIVVTLFWCSIRVHRKDIKLKASKRKRNFVREIQFHCLAKILAAPNYALQSIVFISVTHDYCIRKAFTCSILNVRIKHPEYGIKSICFITLTLDFPSFNGATSFPFSIVLQENY